MAGTTKVTMVIKVYKGPQAKFSFHVSSAVVDPDDAIILGLITVLEAVTRGKVISIEISLSKGTTNSYVDAVYYKSGDKGLSRFKDVNSVSHAYKIPGILAALLLADKETIDPDNADYQDWYEAMLAGAKTAANDDLALFVSGHRTENRKPIKAGAV